jgi:hypothetical protein
MEAGNVDNHLADYTISWRRRSPSPWRLEVPFLLCCVCVMTVHKLTERQGVQWQTILFAKILPWSWGHQHSLQLKYVGWFLQGRSSDCYTYSSKTLNYIMRVMCNIGSCFLPLAHMYIFSLTKDILMSGNFKQFLYRFYIKGWIYNNVRNTHGLSTWVRTGS